MKFTGNAIVDAISKLGINSIPDAWYQNLRRQKTNTLNPLAVLVLWDLMYWYKWTEIKDESSGLVVGYKKKFKADLLQRSYSAIANKFGVTKRVAMETIMFLEELGVVKKECRTITVGEQKIGNVLFIALVPEKVAEISEFKTLECNTSYAETEDLLRSDVIAITSEGNTNTIISTDNSTTTSTTPTQHYNSTPADNLCGSEDSTTVSSSSPEPNPFDDTPEDLTDPFADYVSHTASTHSHKANEVQKKKVVTKGSYPNEHYKTVFNTYMTNYKQLIESGRLKPPIPIISLMSVKGTLKKYFDAYGYETILKAVKESVNDDWLIEHGYVFHHIFGERKLVMLINGIKYENKNCESKSAYVQRAKSGLDYDGEW